MLHFTAAEFDGRMARTRAEMERASLDALLLFAPESQYWLTGYDTFGFCFFQCLVISGGDPVLLTRSADLRQAGVGSAEWTGHCTYSDEGRFFSYRRATHVREADYGRLVAAIAL